MSGWDDGWDDDAVPGGEHVCSWCGQDFLSVFAYEEHVEQCEPVVEQVGD